MVTLTELGKDFVNSKSMATPGFAGGLVVLLANSLIGAFAIQEYRSFCVLGLSFLVGAVVFADMQVRPGIRFVFYVINSLIVFAVAMGANSVANRAENAAEPNINSVIRPIAEMDEFSPFRLAQNIPIDSNQVRSRALRDQVKTISNSILLVQEDLIRNQKKYVNPDKKLDSLVLINNDLIAIHRQLENTNAFSNSSFITIQMQMQHVQKRVQNLHKNMLVEKTQRPREGFFKEWN